MTYKLFGYHCDYFTDRLCRIYTILIFLGLALYMKYELQKTNALANCWSPSHFTGSHIMYTNDICKSGENWRKPILDYVPSHMDEEENKIDNPAKKMEYLPAVLILQSLLFLLPWLLWKFVSSACCSLNASVRDSVQNSSDNMSSQMCELTKIAESKVLSIVLCISYLVCKMMYGILCLLQMAILSFYIGINFFRYNIYGESFTVNNVTFSLEDAFPKSVMCQFQIRRLGNVQRYEVQCTVPASEDISQCLYFIWVWLIILVVITTLSGMISLFQMLFWFIGLHSNEFVRRKLQHLESFKMSDGKDHSKFAKLYITPGLLFALDIIEENGSLLGVQNALERMWKQFTADTKIEHVLVQRSPYPQNPEDQGPYSAARQQLLEAEHNTTNI